MKNKSFQSFVLFALLILALNSRAATVLGPWQPLFKGVERAVGTNTVAGGGMPELMVAYLIRVDLTDPDLRFFASPRSTNWVENGTETDGYTTTNFLKNNGLQVAINANQFFIPGSGSSPGYTLAEGTDFNVTGLVISEGVLVSPQDGPDHSASIHLTTSNTATFYSTNWPMASTDGVFTAVAGPYAILENGVNISFDYTNSADSIHGIDPRTAMGLSQDRHYLYLIVIDGRQNGYSVGAYDWETAEWLKLAGAWDGINLDGGGSSCMVIRDTTGFPVTLNRETGSLSSGRQRTVGAHFGIYAAPLPGLFTNVIGSANDTSATVSWTTTNAATTQLKYGTTTAMSSLSSSNFALANNHAVLLTNLTANTGYYFAALATLGGTTYVSSNHYFATTQYVSPISVIELASNWQYTTQNLNGVNWKARTYNDSGWTGNGPGLLWVEIPEPNPDIPAPMNTQMPENPVTGLPYTTYYFRTHFSLVSTSSSAALQIEAYIDDGAVFYLNGVEIQRVRMAASPTVISNATFATATPCAGDSTCTDNFSLSGQIIATNLLVGDNVLAVEVHNRSAGSADITFGINAWVVMPYSFSPTLNIANPSGNAVAVQWTPGGYTLQQANTPTGSWSDVSGPVVSSPFTTNNPAGNRFFRLRK